MTDPSWTDIASTITGFVGGAAGLAALGVAVWANRNSKDANKIATNSNGIAEQGNRKANDANDLASEANTISREANATAVDSKDAATKANDIAEEALRVSRDSAVSARESAAAALAALKMERIQRHEAKRPVLPGSLTAAWRTGTNGHDFLVVEFAVDHDYRALADAIMGNGNSTSPLAIDAVLHAGRQTSVFVESFAPGQTEPRVEAIRLRFWPTVPSDGADAWACGCGEPELADAGAGHWTKTVRILHPVGPAGYFG